MYEQKDYKYFTKEAQNGWERRNEKYILYRIPGEHREAIERKMFERKKEREREEQRKTAATLFLVVLGMIVIPSFIFNIL